MLRPIDKFNKEIHTLYPYIQLWDYFVIGGAYVVMYFTHMSIKSDSKKTLDRILEDTKRRPAQEGIADRSNILKKIILRYWPICYSLDEVPLSFQNYSLIYARVDQKYINLCLRYNPEDIFVFILHHPELLNSDSSGNQP